MQQSELAKTGRPGAIEALAREVRDSRLPAATVRRRIRQDAGVSLRAAARALEVDPMTILRWEKGQEPSRSHAVAYRQLLDALTEAVE